MDLGFWLETQKERDDSKELGVDGRGNRDNDFKETEWKIVDSIHLHQEGQRLQV
jgi:hypothetical protein